MVDLAIFFLFFTMSILFETNRSLSHNHSWIACWSFFLISLGVPFYASIAPFLLCFRALWGFWVDKSLATWNGLIEMNSYIGTKRKTFDQKKERLGFDPSIFLAWFRRNGSALVHYSTMPRIKERDISRQKQRNKTERTDGQMYWMVKVSENICSKFLFQSQTTFSPFYKAQGK